MVNCPHTPQRYCELVEKQTQTKGHKTLSFMISMITTFEKGVCGTLKMRNRLIHLLKLLNFMSHGLIPLITIKTFNVNERQNERRHGKRMMTKMK